jgi:hypothetical protein
MSILLINILQVDGERARLEEGPALHGIGV